MNYTYILIPIGLIVLVLIFDDIIHRFKNRAQNYDKKDVSFRPSEELQKINFSEKSEVSHTESVQDDSPVTGTVSKERETPLFEGKPDSNPPLSLLDPVELSETNTDENYRICQAWSWKQFTEKIIAQTLGTLDVERRDFITHFKIGANYSCLIGGGIGSGKTTLLHNIICQTIDKYDPTEVQLLLLDLKEGTEFFVYQHAPHVKVLVTGSDPTLGLSAIGLVEQEIKKRGVQFKKEGVKDFADHRKTSNQPLSRWLVIIDEFQSLFYDHSIARNVEPRLDNIVRKGRSFGINFILSTQSLSGINISESTLSQLGIRIALRMQERDAARFLSADNTLPSTFSTAGIAVYNDNNGEIGANRLFQVFPLQTSQVDTCIRAAAKRYPIHGERYILDGSAFVNLKRQEPARSINHKRLVYRVGAPLNLSARLLTLDFDASLPERVAIIGDSIDKWRVILTTWLSEFVSFANNARVTIFDFSNQLDVSDYSSFGINLEVLSNPEAIANKLSEIAKCITVENLSSPHTNELICFYDIGAASMFRREVFDPITSELLENPTKANAINIIKYGPSSKIQITLLSKSSSSIEDVFRLQYDSPIRVGNFDFQIYVDGGEVRGFDTQTLSDHNAYIVKPALGNIEKVILTSIEG